MTHRCDPERSSWAPDGGESSGWPSPHPPLRKPSQHHHVDAPSTCQLDSTVPGPLRQSLADRPTVMKCPPLLYTIDTSAYITSPNGVTNTDASRRTASSWMPPNTSSARSGGPSAVAHDAVYQLFGLQELPPQLQLSTPRTCDSPQSVDFSVAIGSPIIAVNSLLNTSWTRQSSLCNVHLSHPQSLHCTTPGRPPKKSGGPDTWGVPSTNRATSRSTSAAA